MGKDNKVWTKEEILGLIETSDEMVKRSLKVIYNLQTVDEQTSLSTQHNNGVGFNGVDAEILTSFTKQLLERDFLSPKQMIIARKKMKKYASQLMRVANGEMLV